MIAKQRARKEERNALYRAELQRERYELDAREEERRSRVRPLTRHALAVTGRADNVLLAEAEAREIELLEGADRLRNGGLRPKRR